MRGNTRLHGPRFGALATRSAHSLHQTITKILFMGLVAAMLFAPRTGVAENGVYDWIMKLGPITFNNGGGAFLPTGVLSAMTRGQISPIMQFVTANHILNAAIDNSLKPALVPGQRDPFLVAQKKFIYGLCMIKKGWQNAVAFSTLASIQNNNSLGGGDQQIAQVLIQAFQKDPACDGSSGGGIDPNILQLVGLR